MRRAVLRPVTEVKRRATAIIRELQHDRQPVLVTERGRAAAVLVDVQTWEQMADRLELLEGIARGERALGEGRVLTQAQARKRMRRWLVDG